MTEKFTTISRLGTTQTIDGSGRLHSAAGAPSLIDGNGTGHWHDRGVLNREDGPAVDGRHCQIWYRQGKIHRDGDEPAIFEDQGRRVMYYKDDKPHRVFGPAVIEITKHGKEVQFWINGQKYLDQGSWERDAAPLRASETSQVISPKLRSLVDLIEKAAEEQKKKAPASELPKLDVAEAPKTAERSEEAPKKRRKKKQE